MSRTNELVISHTWYEETSAGDREFLVSAELWCPTNSKTPNSLRKPPVSKRTADKRESISGQANSLEEKRLKEKPSWFKTQAQGSSTGGQWLPASCKLSDEGDRCMLNIYVSETFLQDSIYVHCLRCTDIRLADRSLFFHGLVLGIHVRSGQRLIEKDAEDHVYLRFPNSESLNTWTALLRSYAIAEIYGKRLAQKPDGGLYRMWRQVFLEICQVRNLGSLKTSNDAAQNSGVTSDTESPNDPGDVEVSCEVRINECLCGSSTKKGIGALEWHEQFTFSDLPPFGELQIQVYREKRTSKPQLLGTVTIILPNFRRGQTVEGWYPIIYSGASVNGTQIGEMRLKLKVDEEIVLPMSAYKPVLECLSQGNMLDHLTELEQELKLENAAEHIIAVSIVNDVLMRDLFVLADREVLNAASAPNTLFRGNSVLTKTIELAMNLYGKSFLEASIGSAIRRLCADKIAIETDPSRGTKGGKDQDRNIESLVYWCTEFWNSIYAERNSCPPELRQIFHHIRQAVEKRFNDNRVMRWQSVSAFCFLRFIVPGILHPHLFGLCHGMPSPPVQRSLTLIAKALQSLANLNTSARREELLRGGMKEFMQTSLPAMTDYIDVVSTPRHDTHVNLNWSSDEHERIQVMNSLRERAPTLPTLHREAILFLPHLIDLPKHLAILTSNVVRNSNHQRGAGAKQLSDNLSDLVKACNAIEQRAVKHVSKLKRPNRSNVRRLSRSVPQASFNTQSTSYVIPAHTTNLETSRDPSNPRSEKRRSLSLMNGRPSTAPSDAVPPPMANNERRSNDSTVDDHAPPSSLRRLQRRNTRTQLDYSDRRVSLDAYRCEQPQPSRIPSDASHSSISVQSLSEDLRRPNAFMRFLTKR
ncbi:Rho GTPase activation protein [Schizopora paradoxa]|uniref:Rho GTPase activation protein n=1 Tax=Schizopora paradoxa TaxID=27342 RepID=A0A0H2RRJ8_9AGAM|nr:Rho GTPase activation protein [Schizopora paradoxa]